MQVVDKRGVDQEPDKTDELQAKKEKAIIADKNKPPVIKMVRCPCCKNNEEEGKYLVHPQLHFMICLQCGGVFMDKKLVKKTYEMSMATNSGAKIDA